MLSVFNSTHLWLFVGCFAFSILGYFLLTVSHKLTNNLIRSVLYIPARKSTTNAVQLGGLPLSISILFGIAYAIINPKVNGIFSNLEIELIVTWAITSSIIIVYGYLDDKFELRPIVKIVLQISCVLIFSLGASNIISPTNSSITFIVMCFWGLGVVNGSNLLDGLDTLTIKLQIPTYGVYFLFGVINQSPALTYLSVLFTIPLVSFYLFNKEPSKIHMGEIGGSFIGFTHLLLSCLLFVGNSKFNTAIHSGYLALIPLTLPMVELGISFLRRLYNKRAPFKGDKLHLHHIFKNYHELSASKSSNIMSMAYTANLGLMLVTFSLFGPFASLVGLILSLSTWYLAIGHKYWDGEDTINFSPQSLFGYLRKKDVMVIDSSSSDDFKLTILPVEEEGELDEYIEEEDEDKAA